MHTWTDNDKIDGATVFFQAETAGQMLQQMQEYYEGSDFRVVNFVEAPVGDCWLKSPTQPSLQQILDWARETGCVLQVRAPGTHPGGNTWWIDLMSTVFMPVIEDRPATPR